MSENLKLLESILKAETSCSNAGTINAANYPSKDMNNFFGYGNFNGKYWFVGQEENGDSEYIDSIILKWNGIDEIMDIYESNPNSEYLKPGAKLVPTWRRLIRIVLAYLSCLNQDNKVNIEIIKEIQTRFFGRKEYQICSMNLFSKPMPPRSKGNNEIKIIPERLEKIKKMVEKFNPEFVIFYAWKYIVEIKKNLENFGINLECEKDKKFCWGKFNNSIIIICQHATSFNKNQYFEEIGKFTRQKFSEVNKKRPLKIPCQSGII